MKDIKQKSLFHLKRYREQLIKRSLTLCILLVLCITSVFCIYQWILPDKYQAKSSLMLTGYVEGGKISTDKLQYVTALELSASFSKYMDEGFLFEQAAKQLPEGLSRTYTSEELSDMISVNINEMTVCFEYEVLADTPEDALILCEFFSIFSLQTLCDLTSVGRFLWSEHPYVNEDFQYTQGMVVYMLLLSMSVIGVYLLIVFFITLHNSSIQDPHALSQRYPFAVFGSLPYISGLTDASHSVIVK